jgi:serine/threonine protein kinase
MIMECAGGGELF